MLCRKCIADDGEGEGRRAAWEKLKESACSNPRRDTKVRFGKPRALQTALPTSEIALECTPNDRQLLLSLSIANIIAAPNSAK